MNQQSQPQSMILPGWFKDKDNKFVNIEVTFFKGDPEIHLNPFVVDEVFLENVSIGEGLSDKFMEKIENEINNLSKLKN